MVPRPRSSTAGFILGIGAATAAAHIGNNFTTFLIGGLMDGLGFTPIQMGVWSMAETLSYAAAMFLIATRVAGLSPRLLLIAAGGLATAAQLGSVVLTSYPLLLMGRIATGFGFGMANTALNLAARRSAHPARVISAGVAVQTLLYALINLGLPQIGARWGVAGMFEALAALSAFLTLAAGWLPAGPGAFGDRAAAVHARLDANGWRVLAAMSFFTFGSLALWPFMERAAHSIAIPAVTYGRYQSVATVASALGNLALAAVTGRLRLALPLAFSLCACAAACAALTTVTSAPAFAAALIAFNVSWFLSYPLLLGIAYSVDASGRLAVLSSAAWLLMMSLGSLTTGVIAQSVGGYRLVGPMGAVICMVAIAIIWPLARRFDDGTHPRAAE